MGSSQLDWNSNHEFFKFTRGRFIVDEVENFPNRDIKFDMNRLARVDQTRSEPLKAFPSRSMPTAYSTKPSS
ncbi:hypothetical protein N7537_007398 [Penicillium hordei]|uniref:Uncharacterized protein n=1 Tax=Penicillium hordei TaxID=40994 RepID=A0AAD6DYZ7_9EURO|nr:uncharacterized protein N7537_007398 [Penicillium hordei]KAJ5597314.1 hypothetical protein N7537_007398 [Penicillium hordei]